MPSAPRETVTACLIVRDEEERLPGALASVAFCDEIVVVDSGSRDATVAIARAAGATVLERGWPGFAAQRNVAIDHAHGDWILEVDADERVTQRLRAEIEAFLAGPPPAEIDMAALPLRDRFLGGILGPSAKYPKYRYRLFRRGRYRHDERRTVHEGLQAERPVAAFEGDLEHELADGWAEAIGDAWAYARLDSRQVHGSRSAAAVARGALLRPATKFAYRLVVDAGWRDGWRGVAKIGLDCATDAAIVILAARRPGGEPPPDLPARGAQHRLLAVAAGGEATAAALRRLDEAADAGMDTALVTDSPIETAHHVRRVPRIGPLHVIRALDAESQLRAVDAVEPFGARAVRVVRVVPGWLKGGPAALTLDRP